MAQTLEREKLQKFVITVKYIQFIFLSVLFFGVGSKLFRKCWTKLDLFN